MSDLLEEANQDYSHNKRVQIFKKALPFIAAGTLLMIVMIGAKDWYSNNQLKKQEQQSSLLVEALSKEKNGAANLKHEILISLAKEQNGLSDIAKLEIIHDLRTSNQKDKALEELKNLAINAFLPITKNLAKIEYVGILLDEDKLSQEQMSKIQSYLISIDKTHILYANAQIYNALFNIKISNFQSAKEIVNKLLVEENLTESIRSQTEAILNYIYEKESK